MTEIPLISIDDVDVGQKYRDLSCPLETGVSAFEDRLNIPHNVMLRDTLSLGEKNWTGSNDVQSINSRVSNYIRGGRISAEYA